MTVPVGSAVEEFNDDGTPKEPEVKEPEVKDGSAAEVAELRSQLSGAVKELKDLQGSAALVEKLRTVFSDGGAPANPRDEYVRKEILRLMPELSEISQLKQLLPAVLTAMDATVEERISEKAEEARTHVKGLMKDGGFDAADEEAAGYIEEAVTRAIKADKDLLAAWTRGNTRLAVSKAFEKVSAKLFAPGRVKAKQGAVTTILSGPKATPKGAAVGGGTTPEKPAKLDLTDTSREGTRKVHDAAFDYLQELINKE